MTNGDRRRRILYAAAVLLTVAAGLASRRYPQFLPAFLGKYPGDALWAAMVYFGLAALRPSAPKLQRAGVALAISYAVELLQLWRAPWLVGLRETTLGHLVLGSAFSPLDLVAYTVGVAAAVAIDGWLTPRGP